jgi:parallel beta-helix repeat protein
MRASCLFNLSRTVRLTGIVLVPFLAMASPVLAGTRLIVNGSNPHAADSNPGTEKKPLKTISAAAARVHAGDKVIIHGGDYRETVIVKASGTKDAPIVFEAAPGETPVIKGSDVIRHWVRESANVWKAKLPPIPPRSNNPEDPSFWATKDVKQVFLKDGVLLDAIRLRPVAAKKELRSGSFFCDSKTGEIYIWVEKSENPNHRKIEAATRGAWLCVFGSNIVIRGLQMRHASTLAIMSAPACSVHGKESRLENCTITWSDFIGVRLGGTRNSLIHCVIACNGDSGIGGTGDGHLIKECRVIYNNLDRYSPSWHCGGAKLIPRFNKGRIIGNEFAYNVGPGLWLDTNCDGNRIEGNFCHDNEGPGIMVEISKGNQVFNNICVGNRNPLAGNYLIPEPNAFKQGRQNVFIRKRLREKTQSTVVYQDGDGRGIYISSAPFSKVYNNTCYLNEGGGIVVEGPIRKAQEIDMSTHDCRVVNNISVYNRGAQLIIRKNGIDPDTYGNASDYNLLLAVGSLVARQGWGGKAAFSIPEWQRVSGQDLHSREGDPHFAMPVMGDFRLVEGSPALGAGRPLPEVSKDFFGHARPQQRPSIGAAEKAALDYPRPMLFK